MITKTRQADEIPADTSVATVVKFGTCSGTTNTTYAGAPAYRPFYESITYAPRGFGRYNSCDHLRVWKWFSTSPSKGTASLTNPPTGCSSTETWSKTGIHQYAWTNTMWPSITYDDANWRDYASDAVREMWPEVESLLSTLNFTVELPQTKRLLPDIMRLCGLRRADVGSILRRARSGGEIKSLLYELFPVRLRKKALRRIAKELKGHPLNSTANWLSDATLIYNYGWKPLVDDIVALSALCSHVSSQIERLQSGQNLIHKSHFTRPCAVTASRYDDAVAWSGGSPSQGVYRAGRDYQSLQARYSATMSYSWKLPVTRADLNLLAYLDGLGIQANPRILWDALPWTFVVDWFLKVGDYLDTFKERNLEPVVTIHGFCHSYKRHYRLTQDIHLRADRTPSYGRYLVKTEEVKRYTRETTTPNLTDARVGIGSLTTRKVILGSALGKARLR